MNPWPYPCLLADVGGTHVRLALADRPGAVPARVEQRETADFRGMTEAATHYLRAVGRDRTDPPRSAAIAIAAPAEPARRGPVRLTNDDFVLDGAGLSRALSLEARWIVNDFEALAWSLPTLPEGGLRRIGTHRPSRNATMAVVGPGTGLGCAGLLRNASGWHAIAGEGGHATLSARTPFEREVLAAAAAATDGRHVSAERLLSGLGLPLLHRAVARVRGDPAADQGPVTALAITEQAARDEADGAEDTLCRVVVDAFCELLGGYAGNVALVFGATGGVLVGGGVAARLAGPLDRGGFRSRFEDKGRFADYLAPIGTALILHDQPTLAGLSHALSTSLAALPTQT